MQKCNRDLTITLRVPPKHLVSKTCYQLLGGQLRSQRFTGHFLTQKLRVGARRLAQGLDEMICK